MVAFGSATPVSRIVTAAFPVFAASLLRTALGALVLAPVAWKRRQAIRSIETFDWAIIGLIALFGMFGFTTFMLYGMRLASGVDGAVVMSTAPAITAAGAMLLAGEPATWRKLAAVALAVAGVLLLNLGGDSGGGRNWLGIVLVFGAVCCEAAYTLLGRKASRDIDPLLVAFLAAVLSLPLFLLFALWQWSEFSPARVDIRAWAALAWYGAGTLALGSWLWYSGLARTEGSVAAGFMGLMPVSALILSYVLLGEPFHWLHLIGFAVVFAGVLLISLEHARARR